MLLNAYIYVLDVNEEAPEIRQFRLGDQFQEELLRGTTPDGNISLPLMTKGERFIRCKGKCLEREHRGMFPRGAIVTREVLGRQSTIFLPTFHFTFNSLSLHF